MKIPIFVALHNSKHHVAKNSNAIPRHIYGLDLFNVLL